MEAVLTLGFVSVILGTASGAQNVGVIGAIGVGAYIALAGLWGSPISGASMNPARTFGPDVVSVVFTQYWVYVAGPLTGAFIAACVAFVLRGYGGGRSERGAAQGVLETEIQERRKDEDVEAVGTWVYLSPVAHAGIERRERTTRARMNIWNSRFPAAMN